MIKKIVLIAALGVTLWSGEAAFAQTGSGSSTWTASDPNATVLTLDEALRTALDRNYTVRITEQDSLRAALEVTRSERLLLPGANATADYSISRGLTSTHIGGLELDPTTSQGLNYRLGANFNVYNGGGDAARIRSAEYALSAARLTNDWTRDQVGFNVIASYIEALRTRELVTSAEKTLAEARAQLERQQGLYSAGSVPIAQVYQQEAVVGQQEVVLIQAQNNFENAKADLLFLLDIPPTQYRRYTLSLSGIDTSTSVSKREQARGLATESAIQRVVNDRADIAALKARIESSRASIDVTRSALLPSVDLSAGLGGGGNNQDLTRIQLNNSLSGGVSFSVPLYDRSQTRLSIAEQEAGIEADEIRLQQQVQSIRSDIAKVQNNLTSAERALDATERALRSAEESLRLAQERLRVGAGIQLDVIVAQSQVETARTNRVNAVYNYLLAQRQLEYTLGLTNY